jgi:hypothetical protein
MKSVLAIFLTFAFTGVYAQISPGYIFGLNLSTVTLKTKGLSTKPETPVGIHFGGFFEIPLESNLSLEPSLLFSAKGSNFKIDTVDISLSPIYIEVPVIAIYSFGSDAGPYFAWGVGGYKIESGDKLKNISFGSGNNNDLKSFDIGFNFGAGINYKGLLISAQYGLGLSNLAPVTINYSEIKNKVIGISISSLFTHR